MGGLGKEGGGAIGRWEQGFPLILSSIYFTIDQCSRRTFRDQSVIKECIKSTLICDHYDLDIQTTCIFYYYFSCPSLDI